MRLGVVVEYGDSAAAVDVLDAARAAERQGFDSLWLGDHLVAYGEPLPDSPLESVTLMAAIAAVTERARLAWAMLNPGFRPPAVLAKMLATIDQISEGRLTCSLGTGSFPPEYEAYNLPFGDAGERAAYLREVVELLRELWTRGVPDRVSFEGDFLRTTELPFSPRPHQLPHPPIWIGGDSETTLANVKAVADGWVSGQVTGERLADLRAQPDWPKRPLDIVWSTSIAVGETRAEALDDARLAHESLTFRLGGNVPPFEAFLDAVIVGTPEECIERLREAASWGVTETICPPYSAEHQQRIADLVLARLREVSWSS